MNDDTSILSLAQYNNFAECLLLDYWSEDLCRTFVMLIGSIWDASGEMRPKSEFVEPICLVFGQCEQININNSLPAEALKHPELVSWGISEFSLIKVQSVESGLFQFRVLWENDRNIEIICRDFHLRPIPLTAEMEKKYHEFFA